MRYRVWKSNGPRVLPLGEDGPMAIDHGDIVVVAVIKGGNVDEATAVMRGLSKPTEVAK